MSEDSKNKIRRFLRKNSEEPVISKPGETPEQTREFIQRKLLTPTTDFYENQKTFYERMKSRFQRMPFFFWKTLRFRTFMTETFPLLAFVSFSCFILWKMEHQFDEMYSTLNKRKTLKQIEMERENEEIQNALFNDKFESVPIKEKPKKQIYKFEGFDEDEEEDIADDWKEEDADLSTKESLIEAIYDEYLKGKPIPEEFRQEVQDYVIRMKNKKKRDDEKKAQGQFYDDDDDDDFYEDDSDD